MRLFLYECDKYTKTDYDTRKNIIHLHQVQENLLGTGRGIWCHSLFHANALQALRQHTDHAVADASLLVLQGRVGIDREEKNNKNDNNENR